MGAGVTGGGKAVPVLVPVGDGGAEEDCEDGGPGPGDGAGTGAGAGGGGG